MTEENTELPGLTFHLEVWEEQGFHDRRFVNICIRAEVSDWELANKVKAKFDGGMKIYTVGDFKEKMIQVLRKDNAESGGRVLELEAALQAKTREVDALRAKLTRFDYMLEGMGLK